MLVVPSRTRGGTRISEDLSELIQRFLINQRRGLRKGCPIQRLHDYVIFQSRGKRSYGLKTCRLDLDRATAGWFGASQFWMELCSALTKRNKEQAELGLTEIFEVYVQPKACADWADFEGYIATC